MNNRSSYIEFSPDVREAIEQKKPVVALESTIISHGMPFPQNLEVAHKVEAIIKEKNVSPATIAILDGKIKIGLTSAELEYLAKEGKNIPKASRRDLPYLVSKKLNGATTVAATMIAADMAGIRIFATGGIGGVHRGGESSMDVSADLQELARTNVAVICGGAKAILDLPRTLEYLETHGVPVIGVGTNEFPAFYSRNSGLPLDYRLDTASEIAEFLLTKWKLGLNGGVVVANPIPKDHSMDFDEMSHKIDLAIRSAEKNQIYGKDVTPYLLSKIKDLTFGLSLEANIALVCNNANVAAEIAQEASSADYQFN